MAPDQDGVLDTQTITLEAETMPVDAANLEVALTGMANGAGAASTNRISRSDQLHADSAAMWSIAMTTPTHFAALAQRTAAESGSGRTRAETNNPANTAAPQ